MRKFYIHCGMAKTGTSSLQEYFAGRRTKLHAVGFDYPSIGLNSTGTAHVNLAHEVLGHPGFRPSLGTLSDLYKHLREPERAPNVVISSEGFAAALVNDDARKRFIEFIQAAQSVNDEVRLVFMFRKFWRRMESSYLERLKSGRPSPPMRSFIHSSKRWLETFFAQLGTLGDILGHEHIVALDIENTHQNSIFAMLDTMGLRKNLLPRRKKASRNVRLSMKQSAYLYQIQYNADGTPTDKPWAEVVSAASVIRRLPAFRNDRTSYHLFTVEEANEIQEFVRQILPAFLAEALQKLAEPEQSSFEPVHLAEVELTDEDRAVVDLAMLIGKKQKQKPKPLPHSTVRLSALPHRIQREH